MYKKSKILSLLFVMLIAFTFSSTSTAIAATGDEPTKALTEQEIAARMAEMTKRVEEIKKIDRSTLTKQEKKELRKELKEMNKTAKALGQGGVYLSVGAIILIILVLILIL